MARNLFIFIGGSDEQNGDYSLDYRLAKNRRTANWSTLKSARPGDRVLIYIQKPHSACIAKAEVIGYPVKGRPGDYPYRVKVGHFELLPNRIAVGDLKKHFPTWNWLRYPRRGALVPENIAERLWNLVHQKQGVQILLAGKNGAKVLEGLDSAKKSAYWYVPKLTAAGDTVLFYVVQPVSAITAVGRVLTSPQATDTKWYRARVGEVRRLESPIPLTELRKMFRGWKWLRSVNMFAYVSQERAQALLKRLDEQFYLSPSEVSAQRMIEGTRTTIQVSKVERDPNARKKCIELFRAVCTVCGFDFGKTYGDLGDGFIHVHHLKPLAAAKRQRNVNPKFDLRPVCPNCHEMLHRRNPPLTIAALKAKISAARS